MIDRPALVAWRSKAPWPDPVQIEQDLLLSRLMIEIAGDEVLGPNRTDPSSAGELPKARQEDRVHTVLVAGSAAGTAPESDDGPIERVQELRMFQ